MSIVRERTAHGLTLVVAPGPGPITVEAWVGGGAGDEAPGEHGLAHLAEHVALASIAPGVAAALRAARGGVDGWVTPDATVFRATAPPGALTPAIAAVAAAAAAAHAPAGVVRDEVRQVAQEGAALGAPARLAAALWRPARRGRSARDRQAVEAWWRRGYQPARTTVAVCGGGDAGAVRAAVAAAWPAAAPGGSGDCPPATGGRSVRPPIGAGWVAGVRLVGLAVAEVAALAVAATAARAAPPWPGATWVELVALRDAALWLITGDGVAPTPAALAAGLDAVVALAPAQVAAARVATALPLAGVAGLAGELAAGQHLYGDPRWPARLRAQLGAVTSGTVAAVVRRRLAGHVHVLAAARPVGRTRRGRTRAPRVAEAAPPIRRATLPGGTRVVAVRVAGAPQVAVRVAWDGGFADEGPGQRGVVGLLAAAAPVTCATRDAIAETAALGGELAGVAGRWSFGLRSRWPRAGWRDGLALVTACAAAPTLDAATIARERGRLVELARGVAGSPARTAHLAYLAARWGAHPLARDPLGTPAELAALTRAAAAAWWRARYGLGDAVIVVAGDVAPDDAIAEVRAALAAAPPAAAGAPAAARARAEVAPPPLPPQRQLFVAGPAGAAAVVIGLPGLARDHAARAQLDALAALLADPRGRLRAATAAAGMHALRVAVVDGPDAGYLAIALDGTPPTDAAIAATEGVLRALASDGPTAAELAVARAALAPAREPLALADALAGAELRGHAATAPAPDALDAAALARLAAELLRWDDAVIATVRPPDSTPGVVRRATKRLPPHRRSGPRPRPRSRR